MQRFLLLIIFVFSFSSYALPPEQVAEKINNYLNNNKTNAVLLLKNLVEIDSQTENMAGVRLVGARLEKELNALGFHTYWENMPIEMKRAGNLFAIRQGSAGKRILLIGHLDTVFSAKLNPFKYLSQQKIQGAGVSDMKGGDVVMIQALKALNHFGFLNNTTIMVALMGDEENAGTPASISRNELRKLALQSDIVIDFESGPPSLGRRGVTTWELTIQGKQQHSSLIFQPEGGYGASYGVARILNQFALQFSHLENVTVNPSVVLSGTDVHFDAEKKHGKIAGKLNVISKRAYVAGDFRYISNQQKVQVENLMKSIVQDNFPSTHAKIVFTDVIAPMTPSRANQDLFVKLNDIAILLGEPSITPLPPKLRGGGDISYVAEIVPAGLVGLGPIGENEHSVNETMELESLNQASKRAALFLYELTR